MCVVSMVHDHFEPFIPSDWKPKIRPTLPTGGMWPPLPTVDAGVVESLRAEVANLAKVVADFKAAVEAAKVVDKLTAQPDCVDPEKAKLGDRVAELERRLDAVQKAFGA